MVVVPETLSRFTIAGPAVFQSRERALIERNGSHCARSGAEQAIVHHQQHDKDRDRRDEPERGQCTGAEHQPRDDYTGDEHEQAQVRNDGGLPGFPPGLSAASGEAARVFVVDASCRVRCGPHPDRW